MSIVVNSNIASLKAQRNLAASGKKLGQALERLSTGLKINSAKDDAVGSLRAQLLRAKKDGINTARANITNASSVLSVADGAASQLTEIAQSIRSLAVQAADETISASDRAALSDSLTSLKDEYDRIAVGTNFNGVKLLNGTFDSKGIQVGSDQNEQISISIGDARSATIGKIAVLTAQTRTAVITTTTTTSLSLADPSSIQIDGVSIATDAFEDDGVSNIEGADSAIAYVNAINSYSGETGVTAQVLSNVVTASYTAGNNLTSALNLVINGVTVKDSTTAYTSSDDDVANLVILINNKSTETGVVASQDSSNNKLILTASDGRNIDVTVTGADTTISSNVFGMTGSSSNRAAVFRGTFKLTSDDSFAVTGAASEFASGASVTASLDDNTTLDDVTFDTADDAGTALAIMDKVIEQLQSSIRSPIGSTLTRLEFADANAAAASENYAAAESAVKDADIAAETANYTQANILQQAGATVLAQANTTPQIALQLLQNL